MAFRGILPHQLFCKICCFPLSLISSSAFSPAWPSADRNAPLNLTWGEIISSAIVLGCVTDFCSMLHVERQSGDIQLVTCVREKLTYSPRPVCRLGFVNPWSSPETWRPEKTVCVWVPQKPIQQTSGAATPPPVVMWDCCVAAVWRRWHMSLEIQSGSVKPDLHRLWIVLTWPWENNGNQKYDHL